MPPGKTHRLQDIRVGRRFRKQLGDVRSLADSLEQIGLLHPVVVNSRGRLIAGRRRLAAAKMLGWRTIPVHVVDLENLVEGELAENVHRKDFLPSELWAISEAVKDQVATPRGRPGKKVQNLHHFGNGKTRDKIGASFGVSGFTLDKIRAVCESGHDDLIAEMDSTGKIDHAYKEMKRRKVASSIRNVNTPDNRLICCDCRKILPKIAAATFDAVVTDPVFGLGFKYNGKREEACNPKDYWRFFKPVYDQLLRVLKPGGLLALWQTSKWIPYFGEWYGTDFRLFIACKSYIQIYPTHMNYAYDPIVCIWKPGRKPLAPAYPERTHDYFESGMKFDDLARQHPCPRSLDLCEHFIKNFVVEDGYVLDCMAGSGSIPISCERHSRRWLAIEINQSYCKLLQKRLKVLT